MQIYQYFIHNFFKFPSLTGVIRFLMQNIQMVQIKNSKSGFPSLTGVIRFLIENASLNGSGGSKSFRPLQGLFVF